MSILMAFTAQWYVDLRQHLPAQIQWGPEMSHICSFIIWEHLNRLYLNHLYVHTTDSSLEYALGRSLGILLQLVHSALFKEKKKERNTCNVYPGSHWNDKTSFTIYLSPDLIPLLGITGSGQAARPTAGKIKTKIEKT